MDDPKIRLNKYLALCGVGSRRGCDQMILDGLVMVNGKVEQNPAVKVDDEDFVKINGSRVKTLVEETILINKPKGLVCSKSDELNRDTIYALIPPKFQHLNHVGRLDKESEGLLILSNDGELSQALSHPSKKIEKEYIVTTDQSFENEVLSKFLKGVHTPEGKAQAKSVKRLSPRRVKIVLETGLKRQIRMMFQAMNIRVKKLVRVRIGSLEGNGLEPGKIEILDKDRINLLFTRCKSDSTATTLESQAERRSKSKVPKKWARPVSRSHDGVSASDKPKRKRPSTDHSSDNDSRYSSGSDSRRSSSSDSRRSSKPSGHSFSKRKNTRDRRG